MKKKALSLLIAAVMILGVFPVSVFATSYTEIASVSLTDFVIPAPATLSTIAPTCTLEENYTMTGAMYFNSEGNIQFTGTFVQGTTYMVKFHLLANDGYQFASKETLTGQVNGEAASSESVGNAARTNDSATIAFSFVCDHVYAAEMADVDMGVVAKGSSRAVNPVIENTGNGVLELSGAHLSGALELGEASPFTHGANAGGGAINVGVTTERLYVRCKTDLEVGIYSDTFHVYYDRDGEGTDHEKKLLASCTVTVTIKETSDSYISFDLEDTFRLDTTKTEGENETALMSALTLSSTNDSNTIFEIDYGNSGLGFIRDGVPHGTGDGTAAVDLSKDYCMYVTLNVKEGYQFDEDIIDDFVTHASVYINGVRCEVGYADYNSYWNTIRAYIYIPSLFDAEFTDVSLSLGEDLSLVYYATINDTVAVDSSKLAVEFWVNGRTYLIPTQLDVDEYVAVFNKIAPYEILEEVTATLMIVDGEDKTPLDVQKISVEEYIRDLYEVADEETKAMISSLIWYCSFAEEYHDSGSTIWNELGGLSSAPEGEITNSDYSLSASLTEGPRLRAAGVYFSCANRIYVKIADATANTKLTVSSESGVEDTLNCTVGDQTYYTGEILATDFSDVYTFKLYEGETLLQTLTYSVNAYAFRMKDSATMGSLAQALYYYGAAAEAYLGL